MAKTNYPPRPAKKTFSELGEDVKSKFFRNVYHELLNMSNTNSLDQILNKIEEFVREEGSSLSTSQLRNIYDKSIKAVSINELKILRPNLAYIAGRSSNEKKKAFSHL